MNPEMTMAMKRHEEREALRSVIQQWNANRLDLFELSEPNEVNEILILSMPYLSVISKILILNDYFYLLFYILQILRSNAWE